MTPNGTPNYAAAYEVLREGVAKMLAADWSGHTDPDIPPNVRGKLRALLRDAADATGQPTPTPTGKPAGWVDPDAKD